MANVYNRGKTILGNGTLDWDTTAVKCMLVTASYTYDVDHNTRSDITNEITNGGYTAGGNAVNNRTVTQDDTNNRAKYDADDVTFLALAAGDQPTQAILYRDSGAAATDDLICRCALTTPPAPNGGDYKIVWSADGIFYLED